MRRRLCAHAALVLGALLLAGGCIRIDFDRCAETPPHPDCVTDAGRDAASDPDAGPAQTDGGAASEDAGAPPTDAGGGASIAPDAG